jgi:hypothetical protein
VEILCAECNFLHMEHKVTLHKLDRHRDQIEVALKSIVEMLITVSKTTTQRMSNTLLNYRVVASCTS